MGNMSGEGNSYRDVTKALEQGNYLVTNEDGTKSTDFDGKPIRDTIDSIMRRSSVQNEWVKEYLREKINQTQASYAIDYTKKKYSNRQKMCNKIIDTLNEIIGGEN